LNNISTELIEILLKTIDKMGIKKTIQVLTISHNSFSSNERLSQLIILNTCNVFGISERTLLKGRKNNPNRTDALGVASVLLLRMCKISQRQIAQLLHKDPTLINKYVKKFENLDANFTQDKMLMDKMDIVRDNTLKQFEIN
jgi:hypothetical protein